MHRQSSLLQQPARSSVAGGQLLPVRPHAAHTRCSGVVCRSAAYRHDPAGVVCRSAAYRHNSSSSSSGTQQPLGCGAFPPLPIPTRHLSRQRQQQQWQQQRQQHVTRAGVEIWPSLERRSRSKYVNRLNKDHGVAGFFEFYQSAVTGQPVLYIMHPRGHTLEVQLQGATVTRWLKPDGEDLLHVRSDSNQQPGEPINSGIPLAFPQWRDGQLPFNGFADKMEWTVVGTEFDGDFVDQAVSPEEWSSGDVQLAVDDQGWATAPRPRGLIDDEDVRQEGADANAVDRALDAYDAQQQQEQDAPPPPAKKRGRAAAKAKKEQEEAEAAAEAEQEAAAEAAAGDDAAAVEQQAAAEAQAAADADAAAAEAQAAAEAAEGEEDEEEGEDEFEDIEYGTIQDPAPYVILQLKDTEETRAIWPHKFELYYKISLMETDEFPDPREGLPRGIFNGDGAPLGPRDAALKELLWGDDEELSAAAALELAERYRGSNIRNGIGMDPGYSQGERDKYYPRAGKETYTGMRFYTDEDGPLNDEEALDEAEAAAAEASKKPLRGVAAAKAKAAAAAEAQAAAAAGSTAAGDAGDGAAAAEGGYGEEVGDLPPGFHNPEEHPMQIKLEWVLINKDPKGSEPLSFQLGALPHFKTEDQSKHGEFVRVLGLGGSIAYDWTHDSRKPRVRGVDDDYVTFDGERHDGVYVNTSEADVKFCPGSRTHFEIISREGLADHVVWHPGALGVPGLEVEPRFFAQLGAGRLALPKKLSPGDQWKGEFVIRYHECYWDPPVFDRDGAQPLPKLITQRDDADDREDIDEGHIVEGVVSSRLGGGAHVPRGDM